MYYLMQGDSSGPSVQPAKRKRGRPRKDASLKSPEAAPSVGAKKHRPPRIRGPEPTLGQAITGVVEAEFDTGYLISVKVGDSILRGVVFKPGHCLPVAAEDVAPNLPMIKRKKLRLPGKNQETAGQRASKGKYDPPETLVNPNGDADVEMVEPLSISPPVQSGQIFVDEIAAQSEGTTELLQEDVNGGEVHTCEESASVNQVEFEEMVPTNANGKNESIIP